MKTVKQIVLILVLVALIIVMVQNAQPPVMFRFLNWTYQVSPLLMVVLVFVIGFLSGFLVAKLTRGWREE